MGLEIERKFLVKDLSWKDGKTGVPYKQGYIESVPGKVVRVRIAGDKAFLTLKGKTEGYSRLEFEYEIPVSDAQQLLETLCNKPIISKTRYLIEHKGHTWEVDLFHEENDGLLIAEIELQSEDETFEVPAWIGREVSHLKAYRNNFLAVKPYCTWEHDY